jgi:2-keto-4-pentenoate hydratase/2-oxohepta-3-ene-1,7-dioic acid hydratase in catechol pathway
MRLCRFLHDGAARLGFYFDERVLPLDAAASDYEKRVQRRRDLGEKGGLLALLPPGGEKAAAAREVHDWYAKNPEALRSIALDAAKLQLLAPFEAPPKLLLLAGNYAEHIREGGGDPVAREKTFPYVFMKPPSTTINHPGAAVRIPKVSPEHIDWEVELGVVIGKRASAVAESEALKYVAGYTVINDISDRHYRPNPKRQERPRDEFFDWLHGKWHDGFCPMGPCVKSADAVPDPQALHLTLKVNGAVKQNASTSQMIFSVAAVVAFISSWVTLEPGDIISTGTPSGVGSASGTFLKAGDVVEAAIGGIGVLRNTMVKGG